MENALSRKLQLLELRLNSSGAITAYVVDDIYKAQLTWNVVYAINNAFNIVAQIRYAYLEPWHLG